MKVVKERHHHIKKYRKPHVPDNAAYRYRCERCGSTIEVTGKELEEAYKHESYYAFEECPVCGYGLNMFVTPLLFRIFRRVWFKKD